MFMARADPCASVGAAATSWLSVSMGVPGSVRGDGALLAGRLTVSR
jgi:hypothetical protein